MAHSIFPATMQRCEEVYNFNKDDCMLAASVFLAILSWDGPPDGEIRTAALNGLAAWALVVISLKGDIEYMNQYQSYLLISDHLIILVE